MADQLIEPKETQLTDEDKAAIAAEDEDQILVQGVLCTVYTRFPEFREPLDRVEEELDALLRKRSSR